MKIDSWKDLTIAIRMGKYTSVGSYPVYYITNHGIKLSYEWVRDNAMYEAKRLRGAVDEGPTLDRIVACQVNWEDPALYCDETGKRIESAYAEDSVGSDV